MSSDGKGLTKETALVQKSTGSGRHRLSEWWPAAALIKKKRRFSSYIRKFRRDRLQSHKWLTASSYMVKYLRISSYMRKPSFLIYDFATDPIWISLCMRKILFSFLSVWSCNLQLSNPCQNNRFALSSMLHSTNHAPPRLSLLAKLGKTPIRVVTLHYSLWD